MVLGGMMVGKDDIPPLIGRSARSRISARGEAVAAPRDRPPALPARHAARDGQRAGGAAVLQPARSATCRSCSTRADRELIGDEERRRRARWSTSAARRRRRYARAAASCWRPAASARNERLRARVHAAAGAAHSNALRRHTRRRHRARRARRRGASTTEHSSPAFWLPVSMSRGATAARGSIPHLVLDRAKPGLIAVNAAGRRFVNEAASYHDFVVAMLRSHETVPTCRPG